METQNREQAYREIVAYIEKQNEPASKWYCGIASNWQNRLFNEHCVPQKDYQYIVRQCEDSFDARNTEAALHKLGCNSAPEGGDGENVYVYAYLEGSMTNP